MAADLAPELLDQIFSYVEDFSPSLQLDGWPRCTAEWESAIRDKAVAWNSLDDDFAELFTPKTSLVSLIPVSKLWSAIAERRLYRSISISSCGYPDRFRRYTALLRTLSHRKDLRMLVQELLLVLYEDWHDAGLANPASEIALQCVGVTQLTIYVPNARFDPLQLELMGNLVHLQSVVIMSQTAIDYRLEMISGSLPSSSEWNPDSHLIVSGYRWPALKSVTFLDIGYDRGALALLGDDWDKQPPHSALRHFYRNVILDPDWFRLLTAVAPSMQSIHIFLDLRDPDTLDALRTALCSWSSTLHQLSVTHACHPLTDDDETGIATPSAGSSTPVSLDDETLCRLAVLEQLCTDTVVVPPRSLHFFQALRRLDYTFVSVDRDDTSLLDALRQIPSLVRLRVTADTHWLGGGALLSLCGELNIEVELARRATAYVDHGWDERGDSEDDYDFWYRSADSDSLDGSDEYDWEDHYRRAND